LVVTATVDSREEIAMKNRRSLVKDITEDSGEWEKEDIEASPRPFTKGDGWTLVIPACILASILAVAVALS
jgi:hypothetical protein